MTIIFIHMSAFQHILPWREYVLPMLITPSHTAYSSPPTILDPWAATAESAFLHPSTEGKGVERSSEGVGFICAFQGFTELFD